ncbi:GyrI-like domain-containing protein [Pectobacterium colocasium]|uniref:GyrI-like domain-containing protein n=1 Tax=Pectobacterium colocasium TaxID=2878098 RepID=UPI003306198C
MSIRIELAEPMEVLSLRVVGPYYEKIPQGFNEILSWAKEHHLSIDKSLAFYWDDPSRVEADELRADVAITCKRCHQRCWTVRKYVGKSFPVDFMP